MKILIDLTSLSDNFSGIERYALNISKQMILQDKANEYILIFKNEVHEEFEQFKKQGNIKINIIKGNNKLIFNQFILPYNLYKIKADKYIFLAFPSPILFIKRGVVNTIHDLTCWDCPETMKFLSKWYFRISILNAVRISEKIITVSKFSKERIKDKFKVNKEINIIYNGVSEIFSKFNNNKKMNEEAKEKLNLPSNYIMSLGTLEPRKNLKLLIKAYIQLKKEEKINEKLVLVGRKGWKFDTIIDSIDEEIKDDIVFTGFVEDKYLPYIYYNTNLFIMPSIYEGFGIPVIEAASINSRILLSDIPPFLEITDNKLQYFKNNDIEDLKIKIIKMLEEKEHTILDKMNIYRWCVQAKKLLDIIKE